LLEKKTKTRFIVIKITAYLWDNSYYNTENVWQPPQVSFTAMVVNYQIFLQQVLPPQMWLWPDLKNAKSGTALIQTLLTEKSFCTPTFAKHETYTVAQKVSS